MAEKSYEKTIKKNKISRFEKARITNQLCRLEMIQNRYQKARGCFEDALGIEPLYNPARYNLGVLQLATGAWKSALETFERLEKLEPHSL